MKSQNKENIKVWDSSNIAESFPGIVMPLTYSIARRGYELVYKSQAYASGQNWYQLESNHRTLNSMIGIFAGRMYYNLISWYEFISLFPNNSNNQKYLDEQLQTTGEKVYLPPNSYSTGYKVRFWLRVGGRTLLFKRECNNYWKYLDEMFVQYKQLPTKEDILSLLDRYAFIEQNIVPHMGRAVDNDFFVMAYNGAIKKRLKKWLGEDSNIHLDFLGTLHDVISARQAILLMQIAEIIKNDKTALKILNKQDFESLDAYLLNTKAKTLLNEYREKFLHRFAEDQKIEAINPLLEKSGFYSLIKTYTKLDIASMIERQESALLNEKAKSKDILSKLSPTQRFEYSFLLKKLKYHLRIREYNRLLRGKVYAYLRELFIELGNVLEDQKIIDNSKDIYYLDIEELFQFADGSNYGDEIKDLIENRKNKYQSYKRLEVPTRFITKGPIASLPKEFTEAEKKEQKELTNTITGMTASPGTAKGRVLVLKEPIMPDEPFDILVVSHTDPGWTPLIALAKGLIVEHGGILSHAAIVTRELGIPSIIGTEGVTSLLKDGDEVILNATDGTVNIL